ncbi:hypothetical protein HLB42_03795 [Deinococcus sp. D7000]|uniref:Uncharacterized protein n=1 Tax=Deinococcus radiopugnans ATCC 19172 TaxID=585398 RepID=A0A5C4XXR7_9DEIO|nr:hypothetical protein [Deinococcus radiopugnans]MBB6018150.1 hypothetical protein [Deinococcus radiopugnans ATCC 19172]QLG09985.1 hypothetical protein HLB42_03795 [Deinococcus sp. D7000]TNM68250.1 hypothetical protein FHR04_16705 [Deinococcus radiopugnans ATCC 19172]
MNLWRWLVTPDPDPGFNWTKMLKLAIRVVLFATVATLISSLLALTPLRPYLNTWWGSLIFILILYVPMARFLLVDSFVPRRGASAATPGSKGGSGLSSAQRRKERNRYAGVKKGPPKYGGRR